MPIAGSHSPAARIGDRLEQIDTPALIIDLDAFERNLQTMADFARKRNIHLRPHAKTHRCSEIARRQVLAAAVGQCCQKVGEAEVLVKGGIRNILLSNQVIGDSKLDRLAALVASAEISLCFDDVVQVQAASRAAQRANITFGGLVEIETGMQRCGVQPGEPAADLARRIADAPGLRFCGIQAYHGKAQHFRLSDERKSAIAQAVDAVRRTLDELDRAGLPCDVVTGGGTGTFALEAASGVYTEIQPGSYLFMDFDYAANTAAAGSPGFEHSLFVLASVMSVAGADWVVADTGLKSLSGESGLPTVHQRPDLIVVGLSDEHVKIAIAPGARRPGLGEKLLLIPGHCDPTINLHDYFICVRRGIVEAIWNIDARGMSR